MTAAIKYLPAIDGLSATALAVGVDAPSSLAPSMAGTSLIEPKLNHFPYRPGLDGLRAIAVISVIVFHLNERWLPGGYVGVDVFFVLSGYLITNVIVADVSGGQFSLARFYKRRLARVLPASIVTLAAVLLAAAWLYSPQDFASAGALAAASAAGLTNMKLMLQGSYFSASPDAQPLLHYWSLAVEEQFYFFYPILLAVLLRNCSRRTLQRCIGVLMLVSFVGCIGLTPRYPSAAFYLLPTRVWELLAGCFLAVSTSMNGHPMNQNASTVGPMIGTSVLKRTMMQAVGLALIAAGLVFFTESMHFPGWVASIPVIGTGLCIVGGVSGNLPIERTLAAAPLVAVGKRSYSLYLWHWPVFCFVDYAFFDLGPNVRLTLKVVLTLVLAFVSYSVVERPARQFLNRSTARFTIASGVASLAFLLGLGVWINANFYFAASAKGVRDGGVTLQPGDLRHGFVVVGDSNASMYGLTLRKIAIDMNVAASLLSVNGRDPLMGSDVFKDSITFIRTSQPKTVIFAAAWMQKLKENPSRLEKSVTELLRYSGSVVLVTQPPILPKHASRMSRRKFGPKPIFEDAQTALHRELINHAIRELAMVSERVQCVDLESLFRGPENEIRFIDESGNPLWHDANHLSGFGTRLVEEQFRTVLQKMLRSD